MLHFRSISRNSNNDNHWSILYSVYRSTSLTDMHGSYGASCTSPSPVRCAYFVVAGNSFLVAPPSTSLSG